MPSIDLVLSCLVDRLEGHLQARDAREEPWIVPGALAANGRVDEAPNECVFATVLSIASDNALGRFETAKADASGRSVDRSPPLSVDVDIVFAADFRRQTYGVGLRLLSEIIGLLQDRPVIEAEDAPMLAGEVRRLAVEMMALGVGQSSRVASRLGLKGQPFVVYRLRRLSFRGGSFRAVAAAVADTGGRNPVPGR